MVNTKGRMTFCQRKVRSFHFEREIIQQQSSDDSGEHIPGVSLWNQVNRTDLLKGKPKNRRSSWFKIFCQWFSCTHEHQTLTVTKSWWRHSCHFGGFLSARGYLFDGKKWTKKHVFFGWSSGNESHGRKDFLNYHLKTHAKRSEE